MASAPLCTAAAHISMSATGARSSNVRGLEGIDDVKIAISSQGLPLGECGRESSRKPEEFGPVAVLCKAVAYFTITVLIDWVFAPEAKRSAINQFFPSST